MKLVICKKAPHKDEVMDDRQSGHPFMVQINVLRVLIEQGNIHLQPQLNALEIESDKLTIQNIINQIKGSVGWQGHHDYSTDPNDYEVVEIKDIIEVKTILKDRKAIKYKDKIYNKWTETHPDLKKQRDDEEKVRKNKIKALKTKLNITDEELRILRGG